MNMEQRVDAAMQAIFDGLVTGGLRNMRSSIFVQLSSLNQERMTEIRRLEGVIEKLKAQKKR